MKKHLPFLLAVFLTLACVSSALSVPTPAITPTAPPPSPTLTPTPIKLYDNYKVTAYTLEVREAPGETSLNIGYLRRGVLVTVFEVEETPSEACPVWARIRVGAWVCMDRLERVE